MAAPPSAELRHLPERRVLAGASWRTTGCPGGPDLARCHQLEADVTEVRVAFDGDAVLFDAESQRVYDSQGLDAFHDREASLADEPLSPGPFRPFLDGLARIQERFEGASPIRTALVTARARACPLPRRQHASSLGRARGRDVLPGRRGQGSGVGRVRRTHLLRRSARPRRVGLATRPGRTGAVARDRDRTREARGAGRHIRASRSAAPQACRCAGCTQAELDLDVVSPRGAPRPAGPSVPSRSAR